MGLRYYYHGGKTQTEENSQRENAAASSVYIWRAEDVPPRVRLGGRPKELGNLITIPRATIHGMMISCWLAMVYTLIPTETMPFTYALP